VRVFILVLIVATVIGGFVGGELIDRTFSLTGAVVAGVGLATVLLALGPYFDSQEKKKPKTELTPEIRAVFDRMLGRSQSGDGHATRSMRPKGSSSVASRSTAVSKEAGDEAAFFLSTIGGLITVQLLPKYVRPKDSFPALMTNQRAAGYLFGFHDGLLQRLGLRDPVKKERAAALIESSYKRLFGEQAGFALYTKSVSSQDDQWFCEGRMLGGNEIVEYLDAKVPPLGLGRMLILNMEA